MFKDLLLEALKPSQFRDYVGMKPFNEKFQKELIQVFPNTKYKTNRSKDRLYIPFEGSNLKKYNRTFEIYLEEVLSWDRYEIVDYEKGLCKETGTNRNIRIGKYLNKKIEQGLTIRYKAMFQEYEVESYNDVLHLYNEDPGRKINTKFGYLICICKNPYDIAGMSTDRGWTSCMNLETGTYKSKIQALIEAGGLVAYLIREDDLNIEHPLGRISIYAYDSKNGNDKALMCGNTCYGTMLNNSKSFKDTIQNWIDENININKTGIFKFDDYQYDEVDKKNLILGKLEGKFKISEDLDISIQRVELEIHQIWERNYGNFIDIEDLGDYYRIFRDHNWSPLFTKLNDIEITGDSIYTTEFENKFLNIIKTDDFWNDLEQTIRDDMYDNPYDISIDEIINKIKEKSNWQQIIKDIYNEFFEASLKDEIEIEEDRITDDIKLMIERIEEYVANDDRSLLEIFEDYHYEIRDEMVDEQMKDIRISFKIYSVFDGDDLDEIGIDDVKF